MLAEIERNLAASGERRAAFVAIVKVSEGPSGLWQAHLRVETRGGQAERRFEAESCETIASATALIIALAAPVGNAGQGPDPSGPLVVAEQDNRPAAPAPYWQRSPLGVMVSGVVENGIMPSAPGAGLEVSIGPSWTAPGWRVRLLAGAGFLFPRSAEPEPSVHGDFWRLALSGRGCASAGTRFEVGLCVGAELSAMHSTGPLGGDLQDDTGYWISPTASALAAWNIRPRLAVFVRSDVTVPAWHPTFHTDGGSDVYSVPAVAVGAALGIEFHLR